jgi:HD domain
MHRLLSHPDALNLILKPETDLERQWLLRPEFAYGLLWGEPRFGHPEGKVVLHVREVLNNIDLLPKLSDTARAQLRLIALAHDTFKYAEERGPERNWAKHHSVLARQFAEQFTTDRVVLDILEHHDDAFYAWRTEKFGFAGAKDKTLDSLLEKIDYCLQLFYLFFLCDTKTGDKTQAPVKWFEKQVKHLHIVRI